MKKFTRTIFKTGFGATALVAFTGVMASLADETSHPSVSSVADRHISMMEENLAGDLAVLNEDKSFRSDCKALASDYAKQMYGDVMLIIEDISENGKSRYPLHDRVAPFGEAYVNAGCPIGQMVWLTHQKRAAVRHIMEEFIPDMASAYSKAAT